jgi:predicted ATPase/class 3 adenylate cyclase
VRRDLPSGTVTFLFTDIEGSTKLLHELGAEGYARALAEQRRLIRSALAANGGVEVDTQGDAFFVGFARASDAVAAAAAAQEGLAAGPINVRMGLHTGEPLLTKDGYVGADVHKGARIAAVGHGGQVLLSEQTSRLVEGVLLRDLGEHRLKDLSAPERIYQLGEHEFPPLKSLYRTNLPIPATPFLGRDHELREVTKVLSRNDVRLLTLTGPGGTGKTRLALQSAAELADHYPDGVWWVALAPLRDPALVPSAIAQALQVREQPGVPLVETLVSHLRGKRAVVLLDGAEHVLPGVVQAAARLRDADGPTTLVTSRERLQLQGEHVWPVPPLSERDGSVLFVARARQLDPAFAPSAAAEELCRRLDQLPLALELAAARTVLFSPEQLLERVPQWLDLLQATSDADPRQQTLRATIAWSHDLLREDERVLFRRFAVFAGGCTYQAAEEVAGADPDTLQSLLDKSLLRRRETDTEARFWMLETIREYASEQLEQKGDADALRSRHAEWFLRLAEQAEPEVLRGDQITWGHRLDVERDNCRVAISWLLERGHAEPALRLIGALRRAWAARGHLSETRKWLEAALAQEQGVSPRVRAVARYGLGRVALLQGDYDEAVRRLRSAAALYREVGDDQGLVYSLADLSWIAGVQGDHERATALGEESLGYARPTGDDALVSAALHSLACAHLDQGDYAEARPLFEESLARRRCLQDKRNTANSLLHLGIAALLGNDYRQATALFEESLSLAHELENLVLEASVLVGLGLVALFEGPFEDGRDLIKESLALSSRLGDKRTSLECLQALAGVSAAAGEAQRAATLSGAAEKLLELIHAPPSPTERAVRERFTASALVGLGDEALANAYAVGREMNLDQAVEYALQDGVA